MIKKVAAKKSLSLRHRPTLCDLKPGDMVFGSCIGFRDGRPDPMPARTILSIVNIGNVITRSDGFKITVIKQDYDNFFVAEVVEVVVRDDNRRSITWLVSDYDVLVREGQEIWAGKRFFRGCRGMIAKEK